MAIQIGAKPDCGFDDPLGMLKDCHRRIERFLHILCVVADTAAGRALTEEEIAAVQSALAYFRSGGQRHTEDEERSLFPRLRAGDACGQLVEMSGLIDDHSIANGLHWTVEKLYQAWMAGGFANPEDSGQLAAATLRLKRLYEAHIKIEEEIVFPRAAQVLSIDAVAAMGREFRARRA
jgi:hemerythrin-like domain-containing protein